MPITFVKEHGLIDSEGKGGWGQAGGCLPDRVCIQALRALSGLQATEPAGSPLHPGRQPTQTPGCWVCGGKARSAQLLTAASPRPDL